MPVLCLLLLLCTSGAMAAEANIAIAATITAAPATEPDAVMHLVDGRPATQLTFAVGTAGEGIVTFTFDHPRTVRAIRLY